MQIFLDAPQDFENVCVVARTLEALGVERCLVHDPNQLIRAHYGKSRTRQLNSVSAGAILRVEFDRVEEPEAFLTMLSGRKVATVPDRSATSLTKFRFHPNDVLMFGSEAQGLEPGLLNLCEERTTVSQQGVTQSLNLGVAVGIVLFEFLRQGNMP